MDGAAKDAFGCVAPCDAIPGVERLRAARLRTFLVAVVAVSAFLAMPVSFDGRFTLANDE
jgi:hypothetical protein